jgi:hypothetical protein
MNDEREQVIAALRAAGADGLTGSELWAAVPTPRSRRQSLMTSLVDEGVVRAEGLTRARRYWLASVTRVAPTSSDQERITQTIFSLASLAMFEARDAPATHRPPVGYRRELLDAYQPNVTSYLGVELAKRLNSLGRRLDSVAPAGTYARKIYQRFLVELAWSSSRLEGNTYELLDTERLLAGGDPTEGKSAVETRMLLNHKEAIRFLVESPGELVLDSSTLRNLHALLAQDLLTDPADEGRLRTHAVGITGSPYIPLAVPSQLMECFNLILADARAIRDPIECAFFLSVHIPYLQPFIDVNKRTSRLAANIPMIIHNMSPLSFRDVSPDDYKRALLVFYETQELSPMRELFAWAYERSCALYEQVEQTAPAPDRFRMRWHSTINDGLGHLVRSLTEEPTASPELLIEAWLRERDTPEDALPRLAALIVSDLHQLHDGSYARARVSRAEFERWQQVWRA